MISLLLLFLATFQVRGDDFVIFATADGRLRLRHHGHVYAKHTTMNDRVHWRCVRCNKGCRARQTTCSIDGRLMLAKRVREIIHENH